MVLFMRQRLIASVLLSSAIFLSIPVPHSIGDTIVGGFITTDTVWDIGGSPYIAEQSILVMDGATLTIEPGVEVRFDPDKRFFRRKLDY